MQEDPGKGEILGIEGIAEEAIPEEAIQEEDIMVEAGIQEKTALEKAGTQEALVQEEASMEGPGGIRAAGEKADFPQAGQLKLINLKVFVTSL